MNENHKQLLMRLSSAQRSEMQRLSDIPGLIRLAIILLLIIFSSSYIVTRLPIWPLMLVVQGILIVFLFSLLHECIHLTAFRSRWLNKHVANCCGFMIFLPVKWFKHFHLEHHRYTNLRDKDPELIQPKPTTILQYWVHISGIPVVYSVIRKLLLNAMNKNHDRFVSKNNIYLVVREARIYLGLYIILFSMATYFNWQQLIWIWLAPYFIGQPFLRAYLLAEHTLCPEVENMLANTRTMLTNPIVNYIAWNMPYHVEHHILPSVPFHKLPTFHDLIKEDIVQSQLGYLSFHKFLIKHLINTDRSQNTRI